MMPRAPFQVLVYPYYQDGEQIEYAIFHRRDNGIWQAVAGGGEGNETPLEAARREAYEEAGLPSDSQLLRLDTVEPVPAVEFKAHREWGEQVYVIPQYCFGLRAVTKELRLCGEHTEYRWVDYAQAMRLIHYDGNRTALWELECRLRGRRLPYDDGRLPVRES